MAEHSVSPFFAQSFQQEGSPAHTTQVVQELIS